MSRTSSPLDRFLSAFSLASRIPVGRSFVWDARGLDFHLPLVGVPVAALSAFALAAAVFAGAGPVPAALFCLAVQYLAFNLFHLDGLMDSADALLGHGDREKRLAILKDSRIGVYAFFAGFVILSWKTILLAGIAQRLPEPDPSLLALLFSYPVAGRAAGALVPALVAPARQDGLGKAAAGAKASRVVAGSATALVAIWAVAAVTQAATGYFALPVVALRLGLSAVLTGLSAFAAAGALARSYRAAVGGYTGDTQGAAVEAGELSYLCLGFLAADFLGA